MGKPVLGLDFLTRPDNYPIRPVIVLFGDETFLVREIARRIRTSILPDEDSEFSYTCYDCSRQARSAVTFDNGTLTWNRVKKDLATLALFGAGRRLIQLDNADTFVTENRPKMEDYVKEPVETGILLLVMNTFSSVTNFYKLIEKNGLIIDCRTVATANIPAWLVLWAQKRHKITLELTAANVLTDRIGSDLGLLDQELARMALLVQPKESINIDFIEKNVGNWRIKKAWDLIDFAFYGNPDKALALLEQLLSSGETAVGLLAQMAPTVRRFAAATRILLDAEKCGRRPPTFRQALEKAGFTSWALGKAEAQLTRLGLNRGRKLLKQLLEADLALKGDSQAPPRLILEKLITAIAHPNYK